MQKEKIRVYILARELNVDTKVLLDLCKQAGFDVKNQLSSLDHEQQAALEQMVKQGSKPAAPKPASGRSVLPGVSIDDKAVKTLPASKPQPRREEIPTPPPPPPVVVAPAIVEPAVEITEPLPQPEELQPMPLVAEEPKPIAPSVPATPAATVTPTAPAVQAMPRPQREMRNLSNQKPSASTGSKPTPASPPATSTVAPVPVPAPPPMPTTPLAASASTTPTPPAPPSPPTAPPRPGSGPGRVPTLPTQPSSGPRSSHDQGNRGAGGGRIGGPRRTPSPTFGHLRAVPPPTLRPQKPAANQPVGEKVIKPIATFTREQLRPESKPLRPEDLLNPPGTGVPAVDLPPDIEEEDDGKGGKKKPNAIPGRDKRHAERSRRADARKKVNVVLDHGKVQDTDDEGTAARRRRERQQRHKPAGPVKKDKVEITPPITVRDLSEALGVRSVELLFKLRAHGAPTTVTINSTIDTSLAEVIALECGSELILKTSIDSEENLLFESEQPDKDEDLVSRAPIVTVMGHVDHGKTSLLDKIRHSSVVDTEAGGITQVIRAWRVTRHDKAVTFLDTPGHEAFTKMRARGAQVTDIAVIVVAADDGVMPQTEEAIHHAKAAGVSLVVAINKVDMPSANVNRTRQQLYGLDVLPDNMGGDTPFVETSAATGKGIDELLEAISVVAELKELKANPNRPAKGTVLEANLSEGEGVQATLLIRNGTLRRGDVILCGSSYGRVRQMYDDLGRPLQEAGPSIPVRITGLDLVPNADDPFVVLDDLSMARSLAEQRQDKRDASAQKQRAPITLERLTEAKIIELKVILKADFRGSIEAIRKELEKLHHAEVGVKVLEAGIGAITETDVWLALASPEDTMILGFNAVPDERARALAEENGIQIHEYNIIYNLTNDIRAALEGKLKPREEIVHLGRAVVRETFKISRVGTIAGCYVTQGAIRRNAKIRVIREGVVIYPPADRSAGLESLKRYKEDTAEVREGFECGIKVANYDDIKDGDVIEAYRIEQVQRTL